MAPSGLGNFPLKLKVLIVIKKFGGLKPPKPPPPTAYDLIVIITIKGYGYSRNFLQSLKINAMYN